MVNFLLFRTQYPIRVHKQPPISMFVSWNLFIHFFTYHLYFRWFRAGLDRWKIFNDGDNDLLEANFSRGASSVKLMGGKGGTVNIPERVHISTNGKRRAVIRGTYFVCNDIGWIPLPEDIAETLEQFYQTERWDREIPLPGTDSFVVLVGPSDIRRYENNCRNFLPVQRGFEGISFFLFHFFPFL